jgi:hypothetical protein
MATGRRTARGDTRPGRIQLCWGVSATILALALSCLPGHAQDDAAQKMADACNDALGYVGCANLGRPTASPQLVVLHWAALAISESTMTVGASHGRNSQEDAVETAYTNCARQGAKDCRNLQWVRNQCTAVAVNYPKGPYGWADRDTRAEAAAAAMAQCRSSGGKSCVTIVAPGAADNILWTSPLPLPPGGNTAAVDQRIVGTWYLLINPGYWVWRIAANGTYEFHSEAIDSAPSQAGTITTNGGKWSIHALNNGWVDGGAYTLQGTDTLVATGKLGTGNWKRLGNGATSNPRSSQR